MRVMEQESPQDWHGPYSSCMSASPFPDVRHFAALDSTNRYLLDEARAGAPDGLVAVADHQLAGRGRLGRRWEAPPGANLLVSVLLRPDLPLDELHLCTAAVALAALDAARAVTGVEAELKWPNDLVVGERKLAGVLAESLLDGPEVAVVVGIGVNVAWPPPEGDSVGVDAVPDELVGLATSLWRESGRRVPVADVLDAWLAALGPRLADLDDPDGRRLVAADYRARCGTLGRTVRVSLPDDELLVGRVADITVEGHLVVDVGACLRTVTAGDVVHLRDAGS